MQFKLILLFAVTTLAAVACFLATTFLDTGIVSGRVASVEQANDVLKGFIVFEEGVCDVVYVIDGEQCDCNFHIDENRFLLWCEKQNWETKCFSSPDSYHLPCLEPVSTKGLVASSGFYILLGNGEGIYDSDRGRCTLWLVKSKNKRKGTQLIN